MRTRLRRGLVAIVAVTALMLVLGTLGWSIIAMLSGVGVGILLGGWVAGDRNPPLIAGCLGMPALALVVLLEVDIATIGFDRGTMELGDLGRAFLATSVRFSDARVATDYGGSAAATSRGGSRLGTWRVAPIVTSDWTPDKPVMAWAVAYASIYRPPGGRYSSSQWREGHRGGVFFKASVFNEVSDAMESAIRRHRLHAAGSAPLLYWVADPRAALAENRLLALQIALAAYGIWIVVVLGDAMIRRRPARG